MNWPLRIGGLIVSLVVLVAVFGPTLAPQDPMQENTIIQVEHGWETPPFPPFTVHGFPLGSDQFGRDLLSRLLWAVRPTLIMVVIVSAVRLTMGITVGLGAGWSTGRFGHALDMAIAAALSVPVLIVSLAAIAVVGVEWGLLAFIFGLSITGWVETARYVRDQTQVIKSKLYIEAARALGASDSNILLRHVLRQIMPMIWMLFAFVISSTLLTTAGLGFLGYYIGGDVWVDVDDFVARRLSGTPELGQMLASAWSEQQVITEPWGMIIAGSVVFIAVLGFNLLGEGLRLRLGLDQARRHSVVAAISNRIKTWAEAKGLKNGSRQGIPSVLGNTGFLRLAIAGAVAVIAGGALLWWSAQGKAEPSAGETGLAAAGQGAPLWASERHDAQGTLWCACSGPADPLVQWVFQDSAGFAGGPAVSADGTAYIASSGGTLFALDPSGSVLWQTTLIAAGIGAPALSAEGTTYVADIEGGLSAFSTGGNLLWRYLPSAAGKATTGPIVGANGTIYYPSSGKIHAVSPEGEPLWTARAPYGFDPSPPLLNPSEELLIFLDAAFSTKDGSPYDLGAVAGKASNERYFMGADGQAYYRTQGTIVQWGLNSSGVEVLQNLNKQVPGLPRDAGVTPSGVTWATYSGDYTNPESGIVWLDWNDQVLGDIEYEQKPNRVIGVGLDAVMYTCGNTTNGNVECAAAERGAEQLLWQIALQQGSKVVGGALVSGRLYVSLDKGSLYAIGAIGPEEQTLAASNSQPRIINVNPSSGQPTPTATAAEHPTGTTPLSTTTLQPTLTPTRPLPETVRPGDTMTYSLSVINRGPSGGVGVVVTDTLPSGVSLISAASSQGFGCVESEGRIICALGDLPSGANATVTVVVMVGASTTRTITHTAIVASQVADPETADNAVEQSTTVRGAADLTITP
jgi:peptide/nickel transport system permease protein